ncbi:MAG: aldose 1-epimerase [Saprospiraceae bacterium]|jgi:aldose 1-epimerase
MHLNISMIRYLILVLIITSCGQKKEINNNQSMEQEKMIVEDWGISKSGEEISMYTLKNSNNIEIGIITFGGIIQSIKVPDSAGNIVDIVLGFDALSSYEGVHPYFGAIVGRYGNRIAKGSFKIDGAKYSLATNNGENHLHGGAQGFDKRIWKASPINSNELQLTYNSAHMEEGYPGNLEIAVTYTLTQNNELIIAYEASTDKATHVNLTNHSYFNLNGSGDILEHEFAMSASRYTPVDKTLIPIGEKALVSGTPFDFNSSKLVGHDINAKHEQIQFGGGYDHNWVLDNPSLEKPFARLSSSKTGILLEVFTTEPGVQFYSGNFLDGTLVGKNDVRYVKRSGLCLETQHFPDSPNQPSFPSTLLTPNQKYRTKTIYKFGNTK